MKKAYKEAVRAVDCANASLKYNPALVLLEHWQLHVRESGLAAH